MEETNSKQYIVRLSARQLKALADAAELGARVRMGQLDEVRQTLMGEPGRMDLPAHTWYLVEREMADIFRAVFPEDPLWGGPNIRNSRRSETTRILFDLHQVFRNRLAWDREEGVVGKSVHHFDPHRTSREEALCEIIGKELEEAWAAVREGDLRHARIKLQEALGMYEREHEERDTEASTGCLP